uniref:Uncharacterized protein n=1 Tax=Anguilla anguilla TaxID=7936 RepID=A0A0E9SIA4_ANGAN
MNLKWPQYSCLWTKISLNRGLKTKKKDQHSGYHHIYKN